jgi:hypothetical protein
MKVVYFVNTKDNHKDELCVFEEERLSVDRESLADDINNQIKVAGFLEEENPEVLWEIGRSLAYTGYASCQEYEFGIESVVKI